MLTFLLIVGMVISVALNIATLVLIKNLLTKIDIYQNWVIELRQDVLDTLNKMRKIDEDGTFKSSFNASGEGVFESDDQVGQAFKELLSIVETLNEKIQ